MTRERYNELTQTFTLALTPEEVAEGWHWCHEFDGLLVKGDPNEKYCGQHCVDAECGTSKEPVELPFGTCESCEGNGIQRTSGDCCPVCRGSGVKDIDL